jgi:hypothetical protein
MTLGKTLSVLVLAQAAAFQTTFGFRHNIALKMSDQEIQVVYQPDEKFLNKKG